MRSGEQYREPVGRASYGGVGQAAGPFLGPSALCKREGEYVGLQEPAIHQG